MKMYGIAACTAAAGIFITGCGGSASVPQDTSVTGLPAADEETQIITSADTEAEVSVSASETDTVTEPPETVTETETEPLPDLTYPAEFSFYDTAADRNTEFDEDIAAELENITGVKLDIILPNGDPYEELMLMNDSGTLPDLIFGGENFSELADSGCLVQLDGYMDTLGDNLKGMYGTDIKKLRYADGHIYTVGTGGALNEGKSPDGVFQIQHRVLREAGYPEIKTLDDLEKVMKDYLEAHPTNPNGTKNIGMLLCGGPMTQWHITVGARSGMVLGYPDDGDYLIDDETNTAVYKWTDERIGKYYKWLNHLYNEGLLTDDSFTLKYREYVDKVGYGNALVIADNYEDFADAQQTLIRDNLGDRTYFPIAVTADESINDAVLRSSGFEGWQGIGISRDCADPERAFEFLDIYCTDEVQMLVNRGVEGINYTVDDNILTEIKPAGQGFIYPFPMAGDGAADSRGIYFMKHFPSRDYTFTEKQTLEAYGAERIEDMFTPAYAQPVNRHGSLEDYGISEESELSIIESGLEVYIRTEVTNAIKLPEDEFDAKWAEIQDFIRNGGGDMLSGMMTEIIRGGAGGS